MIELPLNNITSLIERFDLRWGGFDIWKFERIEGSSLLGVLLGWLKSKESVYICLLDLNCLVVVGYYHIGTNKDIMGFYKLDIDKGISIFYKNYARVNISMKDFTISPKFPNEWEYSHSLIYKEYMERLIQEYSMKEGIRSLLMNPRIFKYGVDDLMNLEQEVIQNIYKLEQQYPTCN